jgi:hypothetical protein
MIDKGDDYRQIPFGIPNQLRNRPTMADIDELYEPSGSWPTPAVFFFTKKVTLENS